MKQPKVIYYRDPLHDDFSTVKVKVTTPPKRFRYIHTNPLWKATQFFLYRIIVTPIAWLYLKVIYHSKIVNRKAIKKAQGRGFYLYGNHTGAAYDAFHPSAVSFPKKAYILGHPDVVSIPGIRTLVQLLGSMPLFGDYRHSKECLEAIGTRIEEGDVIFIYPEAHIWPYCTFIRPFDSKSFRYPVRTNSPVFACTTTFSKKKFGLLLHLPKLTVYVDGPFYPDPALTPKENQEALRNKVYESMVERSKLNTFEKVRYVKIEEES